MTKYSGIKNIFPTSAPVTMGRSIRKKDSTFFIVIIDN